MHASNSASPKLPTFSDLLARQLRSQMEGVPLWLLETVHAFVSDLERLGMTSASERETLAVVAQAETLDLLPLGRSQPERQQPARQREPAAAARVDA